MLRILDHLMIVELVPILPTEDYFHHCWTLICMKEVDSQVSHSIISSKIIYTPDFLTQETSLLATMRLESLLVNLESWVSRSLIPNLKHYLQSTQTMTQKLGVWQLYFPCWITSRRFSRNLIATWMPILKVNKDQVTRR